MKQLLQNLQTGDTSVEDVPVPTPQMGEVLVRTAFSLVSSGTERSLVSFAEKSLVGKARSRPDLVRQVLDKARREGLLTTVDAAFGKLKQPVALGYSSAGTIVEVGTGLTGYKKGQRVACAGGGYAVHAEYVAVPHNLVTVLPDEVDFESGAFTTLGAIALHGFRLANVQIGARIAVIGLGLLGLLTCAIARAAGCTVLGIDLDPRRVELGKEFGAEAVLRENAVEASYAFAKGKGCDAILICADTSSNDPVELAGELARDRAIVVAVGVVGLGLPNKTYFEKEITFLKSRSYGPGRYDPEYEEGGRDYPIGYVRWTEGRNFDAFVDLLREKRIDVKPLITHRYAIEEAREAYETITGKRGEPFMGVLIKYPSGGEGYSPERRVEVRQPSIRKEKTVRLGVIGAGNFATSVLLPAIRKVEGIDLVGIVSSSGMSARDAASRFGFTFAASDVNQVLEDPTINTIAILTRHDSHAGLAIRGLNAGKNVFCEKPLALSHAEINQIERTLQHLEETERPGPLLMGGFNRRFAPMSKSLKEFFTNRSEAMLIQYRVNAGFIPLDHWLHDSRAGGGRIVGEGCHFIDFLTFLVDSQPVKAKVQGIPDAGRYQEDNVLIVITFEDGSLGSVIYLANGDKSLPKERVEVFCEGRVGVLDDFRSLELVKNGRREVIRSRLRQDKGHKNEWEEFTQAIREGGAPPIPYEQMISVARATITAVEALRSGEEKQILVV